jgi:hypothetical protein
MQTIRPEVHSSEKANHVRISEILETVKPSGILRAPKVILGINEYITEVVDRRSPLWYQHVWESITPDVQKLYIDILKNSIHTLAQENFFLRGVEVYLQMDGTLRMINFSKVHHTKSDVTILDLSKMLPLSILETSY